MTDASNCIGGEERCKGVDQQQLASTERVKCHEETQSDMMRAPEVAETRAANSFEVGGNL